MCTKKHALYTLVVLVMALCVVAFVSCGKNAAGDEEHTHVYIETVVAPTCAANGYTRYICECGDTYTANETFVAHSMTSVVEKAPTCTEEGSYGYSVCSVCGFVDETNQTQTIAALGHKYNVSYNYPTFNACGERISNCERCGDSKSQTINAISVRLPSAAEVISGIIGNVSYKLELEENSKLVYVTELSDYDNGKEGLKGFVYFNIAEAMVSGKGETLSAHLKLKVATTQTKLTGLVPAKDVVAPDDKDVAEINLFVNGDAISVEMIDPNGESQQITENISEAFYEALGSFVGIDKEEIEQLLYVLIELSNFVPIAEKLAETAINGIPTISPEYTSHVTELLSLVGDEFVESRVDAYGNTVYKVNPAAFVLFLGEIEGKTVEEYLDSVYGKGVVKSVFDFLATLPQHTVREVAEKIILFVEETGIDIEKVYTIIDLYVYFTTGVEFDIQNEIFAYYDKTFAEVVAESAGISEDEKAEYINTLNSTFASIATTLNTITVDEVLSTMFGTDVMFISEIRDMVNAIDSNSTLTITEGANGDILNMTVILYDCKLIYAYDDDSISLTVSAYGVEAILTENENGFDFVVKENGAVVAIGEIAVTTVENKNSTTNNIDVDMVVDGKDVLDCVIVVVNDEIISADALIREGGVEGYETRINYNNDKILDKETLVLSYYDVVFSMVSVNNENENSVEFTVSEDGTIILGCSFKYTDVINGADVTTKIVVDLYNDEDDLFDYEVVFVNDVVKKAQIVIRGYEYIWNEDTMTEEKIFNENIFSAGFEIYETVDGSTNIRVEILEEAVVLGYKEIADGFIVTIMDGADGSVIVSLVVSNGITEISAGNSVYFKIGDGNTELFISNSEFTVLDALISVLERNVNGATEYVINVDLDQLLLLSERYYGYNNYVEYNYIEFDGVIKLTIS